jgi:hypothetical protein
MTASNAALGAISRSTALTRWRSGSALTRLPWWLERQTGQQRIRLRLGRARRVEDGINEHFPGRQLITRH